MSQIPDIARSEQWVFKTLLKEGYGRDVELQYADAEIRLSPSDHELANSPVYWEHGGCNFVIFKAGDRNHRCQSLYRIHQR